MRKQDTGTQMGSCRELGWELGSQSSVVTCGNPSNST